jgi:LysR family transcriptional regulator, glycine cleavage system transcriptional activator
MRSTLRWQGVAICSSVLIGPELASGVLVPVSKVTLPGYGYYVVHRSGHPKLGSIDAFAAWARSVR